MTVQHKNLASGRWHTFSLMEQMGNIGSEIHRALVWKGKDINAYQNAVYRALELMDFTLQDPRWREVPGRLKELARAREAICDAWGEGKEYGSTFDALDNYFFQFALAARANK